MSDPLFDVFFTVDGPIVPKGRPRFGRTKTGIPIAFTDKRTEGYESAIRQMAAIAMRSHPPYAGPVFVYVVATIVRPDGVDRPYPTYRGRPSGSVTAHTDPDTDNVLKIALDGINKIVFKDDIQVVELSAAKRWGEKPSLFVRVIGAPESPI